MPKGLFIIGTDTEVGKTVVSAGLMYLLLKGGYSAGYFKPIASGEIETEGWSVPADASFVKIASGYAEAVESVTPFSFKRAVSPHLASRLENRAVDFELIMDRLRLLTQKYDCMLVEGCGGLAVPLNSEGFMLYDFIRQIGFTSCLLVARAGLGTINHTLLTLRFAESLDIDVRGIILNGYTGTEMEADNLETLKKLTAHPFIIPIPALNGVNVERLATGNLQAVFDRSLDIRSVVSLMETLMTGLARRVAENGAGMRNA